VRDRGTNTRAARQGQEQAQEQGQEQEQEQGEWSDLFHFNVRNAVISEA